MVTDYKIPFFLNVLEKPRWQNLEPLPMLAIHSRVWQCAEEEERGTVGNEEAGVKPSAVVNQCVDGRGQSSEVRVEAGCPSSG